MNLAAIWITRYDGFEAGNVLIAVVPSPLPRQHKKVFEQYLKANGLSSRNHSYWSLKVTRGKLPDYINNPNGITW